MKQLIVLRKDFTQIDENSTLCTVKKKQQKNGLQTNMQRIITICSFG